MSAKVRAQAGTRRPLPIAGQASGQDGAGITTVHEEREQFN